MVRRADPAAGRDLSLAALREREFAFYGDVDVVPTETYTSEHSDRAIDDAHEALEAVQRLVTERSAPAGEEE